MGSVQGIGLGKALLGVVLVSWRPQSETDSPNLTLPLALLQIFCMSLAPLKFLKMWPRPEVKNSNVSLAVVACAFNPRTQETKAGETTD